MVKNCNQRPYCRAAAGFSEGGRSQCDTGQWRAMQLAAAVVLMPLQQQCSGLPGKTRLGNEQL